MILPSSCSRQSLCISGKSCGDPLLPSLLRECSLYLLDPVLAEQRHRLRPVPNFIVGNKAASSNFPAKELVVPPYPERQPRDGYLLPHRPVFILFRTLFGSATSS